MVTMDQDTRKLVAALREARHYLGIEIAGCDDPPKLLRRVVKRVTEALQPYEGVNDGSERPQKPDVSWGEGQFPICPMCGRQAFFHAPLPDRPDFDVWRCAVCVEFFDTVTGPDNRRRLFEGFQTAAAN